MRTNRSKGATRVPDGKIISILARPWTRRLALPATALAVVFALACQAQSLTDAPPLGAWGGPQGTLTIYADSATLDLPCAVGRISGGLVTAEDGTFSAAGSYAIQAGPVSIDGPMWRPASYSGQRDGDRIQLFITLADTTRIGPFMFERGVVRVFPRCL